MYWFIMSHLKKKQTTLKIKALQNLLWNQRGKKIYIYHYWEEHRKFLENGVNGFQIFILFSVDKTKLLSHKALVVLVHLLIKWNKEAFRTKQQRARETLETEHFKMSIHAQKNPSFWIVFLTDFFWSYKEGMSEWNKKIFFFLFFSLKL